MQAVGGIRGATRGGEGKGRHAKRMHLHGDFVDWVCLPAPRHTCNPQLGTHAWHGSARRLAAQLARTEEAAKRALVQSDPSARGGAAQRLLDAERALSKLRDENAELRSKWARWEALARERHACAMQACQRVRGQQQHGPHVHVACHLAASQPSTSQALLWPQGRG